MTIQDPETVYAYEHRAFAESVREFVRREAGRDLGALDALAEVPADLVVRASELGFVGIRRPEPLGGLKLDDLRFSAVLAEEMLRGGVHGLWLALSVHADIGLRLLVDSGVLERAPLTAAAVGEDAWTSFVGASFAGGSTAPLRAERVAGAWSVTGSCSFAVGARGADLLVVEAADQEGSPVLLVVRQDTDGVRLGPERPGIGMGGSGVTAVHLTEARAASEDLLARGDDAARLMSRTLDDYRLLLAAACTAGSRSALESALTYAGDRHAFGRPIATFENTQVVLRNSAAELITIESHLRDCLGRAVRGKLSSVDGEIARRRATDLFSRSTDTALQLHGGYGYMLEYPISRSWSAARCLRQIAKAIDVAAAEVFVR